jgi:hypothetical protein
MMMNKKQYLLFCLIFICISIQAQMFDYTTKKNERPKIENNKYNLLTNIINDGFNAFEENLRTLSLWEVNQYKRVILEIEKETEGMPPQRKENYKNKKILELSILLNDKEMELQYQYIELVDFFNDKAIENGITAEFILMMQIEGRLQDAVFKMAMEHINEEKKQENIHDNTSYGTDAALLSTSFLAPATGAIAATASTVVGVPVAVATGAIVVSAIAAELMISYTVDQMVSNFLPDIEKMTKIKSWYFINGLCVHARKTYIEQVNSTRKF